MKSMPRSRLIKVCMSLLLTILATSCSDIEIEDNQRLLFKLKVVNAAQQGIESIDVRANAVMEYRQFAGGDEKQLGQKNSSADGTVNLVALAPRFEDYILLLVNTANTDALDPASLNPTLSSTVYLLSQEDNQLEYTIPKTTLREKATLTVRFQKLATTTDTLEYRIAYENRKQFVNLSELDDPFPGPFPESGTIYPNQPTGQQVEMETLQATEAILEVTTLGDGAPQREEIRIPITTANQTYTYEY